MTQILYIASVGYSGSTLLDMLLGSDPRVTSVGEVYLLSRYAKENASCTCGAPVRSCTLWQGVRDHLAASRSQPDLDLAEFPLTIEEKIQSIHRRIPTPTDILLVLGRKSLWDRFGPWSELAARYREASRNALAVFDAVSELEGTPIIVDSSKYALPMKAMYLAAPERVRIVYLVRDGRANARSLMRRQGMTMEQASRRWKRYNWNLQLAMRSVPDEHKQLVRYEDLCRDPERVLAEVAKLADVDPPFEPRTLQKSTSHNIGGNPMRFRRDEVEIKLDEKWKREMAPTDLDVFERIAGDMNRELGYSSVTTPAR